MQFGLINAPIAGAKHSKKHRRQYILKIQELLHGLNTPIMYLLKSVDYGFYVITAPIAQ